MSATTHLLNRLSAASISLSHHTLLSLLSAVLSILGTTAAFALVPYIYSDYRAYIALGEGGFPHNVLGWLLACTAGLLRRETTSTGEYLRDPETTNFLGSSLPRRTGERPKTARFVVPHRQAEQLTTQQIATKLPRILVVIAESNPTTIELRKSVHERHALALFVAPGSPCPNDVAKLAWLEIGHVHEGTDNSLHVVLAPRDCKEVIEKCWGERHPLSGRVNGVPKEYLMIYTPRNEDELEVVRKILTAAARFLTGREVLYNEQES